MIFHENCLPADNSHETSYLFFRKLEKMSQNLSSAAVVIEALRVDALSASVIFSMVITIANSFDPDEARRFFGLGLY